MPRRPVRLDEYYYIMYIVLSPTDYAQPAIFYKRTDLGAPLLGYIPHLALKRIRCRIIKKIIRHPYKGYTL